MWGHDLRRVGRIDEAIAAFRRTDELEKAYYAAEGIAPELDWHHVHNLDLLATSYQHKGQMRRAEDVMREAMALPPTTDYLEFNQKLLTMFLLGRERWDDALESARRLEPREVERHARGRRALAGHALAGPRPRRRGARGARAAERELASVPALGAGSTVTRAAGRSPGSTRCAASCCCAKAVATRPSPAEGRRAHAARLPGPDAWIQALFRLEAIARTARDVGDWELAECMAGQMLEHDAAYGGSHLARPSSPSTGGTRRGRRGAGRGRALLARRGSRPARARHGPPPPRLESLTVCWSHDRPIHATAPAAAAGYSDRSATTGVTRVARRAGTSVATSATPARTSATPSRVTGSPALTP